MREGAVFVDGSPVKVFLLSFDFLFYFIFRVPLSLQKMDFGRWVCQAIEELSQFIIHVF